MPSVCWKIVALQNDKKTVTCRLYIILQRVKAVAQLLAITATSVPNGRFLSKTEEFDFQEEVKFEEIKC